MLKTYQLKDGTWICSGLGYIGMSLDKNRAIAMWTRAATKQ